MGLGKTVQSVSFVNELSNRYNVWGPFLIVAPLSTIPHWEREFAGWTTLNVITYHGTHSHSLNRFKILFSPAFGLLQPMQLAEWMVADHVEARLNLQQHKYIWHPRAKGV
jgi:SNF2 family DNA or RNA helicase